MGNMLRAKARWAGFTGSPGWSNFYFNTDTEGFWTVTDAEEVSTRLHAFFLALKPIFPPTVNITVQSDVDEINPENGVLERSFSGGVRESHTGSAPNSPYSAASGAVITWRTAGVMNGRRVRGRTFLVPVANSVYAIDGTLESTAITTLTNAANTLRDTTGLIDLGVWGRPQEQHNNAKGEIVPARLGAWHKCTNVSVPDKVAVLRSRRD